MTSTYIEPISSKATELHRDAAADLSIERRPLFRRHAVEALFYFCVLTSIFSKKLGFSVPFLIGGSIAISGALTLAICLAARERLSLSLWICLALNAWVNFIQLLHGEIPLIGPGLPTFLHWFCYLLMISYIIQDAAAQKRLLCFLVALTIVVVFIGGIAAGDYARLELEDIGSGFSNTNRVAYYTGTLCMALLFWSMHSAKIIRPVLWGGIAILFFDLIRTVSRGGWIAFACGLGMLLIAFLGDRRIRVSGLVFLFVAVLALSQAAFFLAGDFQSMGERTDEETSRMSVYSYGTLLDLKETAIVGWGVVKGGAFAKMPRAGLSPHNSFIYTHMGYGGPAAWLYLIWIIILSLRVLRTFLGRTYSLHRRCEIAALFGMTLIASFFSNMGYTFITTIYVTAYVEKYTDPLVIRRIYSDRKKRESTPEPAEVS